MARLRYLDSARQDIIDTLGYVARESGSLDIGQKFLAVLRQKCRHLAGRAGRARSELRPDMRSFPFHGYVIFFRYVGDVFEVINIIHGSRDIDRHFETNSE